MSRSKKNNNRWVVGQHASLEAIKHNPQWVGEVNFLEGKERDLESLVALAQKNKLTVKWRGKKHFNALAEGHQGVAVSMTDRPRWDDSLTENNESLVVFLDGITDPHNMGAILRTAWLMGVDGIFIPKDRAVDLTPVAAKVASGGAEHVPVESCHFASQLEWFKEKGYWVYALSEKGQVSLPQQKPSEKKVLVVGAEGKGIRKSTESFCDQFVSIPQVESGSSYNASVAFALCAYEYTRHRHL